MKINTLYFLLILFLISCFLVYLNGNFFDRKFESTALITFINTIPISILFLMAYTDKIDFIDFASYLTLFCILSYIIFDTDKFKICLLSIKSYYVFLLTFVTCFSFYEVIFKTNIYKLHHSKFILLPLLIISLSIYVYIEKYLFNSLDKLVLEYILYSCNIFIPVSMFVLLILKNYSLFYILINSRHAFLVSILFLASALLELYFGVFLIIAINKSYSLSIYKHKNEILNMQYELQLTSINQLEEYQSDIRRISHDIHNHKIILHNLIISKDYDNALRYLDSYGSGFSDNCIEILTNNKILNALFLNKKNVCLNNNINLYLDLNVPKDISISDFDLCIMVGNLMDNAIEACTKIDCSENRYIKVKCNIINSNFILNIENNFNGSINKNSDTFVTSKKDKLNHGLGMSNVNSTIEKYFGNFESSFENNIFKSIVFIPIS